MTHATQPAQAPLTGQPAPAPAKGSNGLATAGFVLGLLGLLSSWIPVLNIVGILLGVIGVILASVGLVKSRKVNAGKGLAIAGIILGSLAVIFAVLINVIIVSAVDEAIEDTTSTSVEPPSEPGDDAADDAAASDAELGATREDPAPLGSAITGDDWTVTINSVKTVNEDSMGQKPAAGSTLISVNMSATYNGDDEQGTTPWASVTFVGPDGATVDSTDGSTLFIAENEFDSLKTVYTGGSVEGDRLFEVPAAGWQDGVLAVSPGMMSDDTFVAAK